MLQFILPFNVLVLNNEIRILFDQIYLINVQTNLMYFKTPMYYSNDTDYLNVMMISPKFNNFGDIMFFGLASVSVSISAPFPAHAKAYGSRNCDTNTHIKWGGSHLT